jgi:hypothetical protein
MIYGMTDDEIVEAMQQLATENEILNDKLAKAVEAISNKPILATYEDHVNWKRTTLAEIESSEAVTLGEKT